MEQLVLFQRHEKRFTGRKNGFCKTNKQNERTNKALKKKKKEERRRKKKKEEERRRKKKTSNVSDVNSKLNFQKQPISLFCRFES